jgi:serine/threonine-protein kinase
MSTPVNVGDILASKYQVEGVIGVGGMGVVVSARHLVLGERVAIKFLLPQALAREDVVERFKREGLAANRLRGEHIGRVHDVGELPTGAPYLVMEYLDGKDLGAILREDGPLPIEHAVDYVVQACEALAEAHSAGIIHRDLKPSNLFVIQRLDGTPSVKLIDFGISKIQLPGAEGAEGEMTATAVMMGSPLYMAPEQMASARDVDGRADIWSLGIILHTMLTGTPPFRAPSVMQIYELIVQGAPPIRRMRADVPEGLEAAILKCLQKDRRQRFGDVGELAVAIAGFGPPEAPFTAERTKRIISARATRDGLPIVSIGAAASPGSARASAVPALTPASAAATEHLASGGAVSTRTDSAKSSGTRTLPVSPGGAPQGDGLGTGGPWDQKTHPPPRRARPAALIAAVAAALIGAPAAFLLLRADHGAPVAPPADSVGARALTANAVHPEAPVRAPGTSPVEPAQPSVQPGGSTATGADPSSSKRSAEAGATATPKPEATASSHVRHYPPPPPPPPRQPRIKSPDDLFDTQK